MKTIRFSGKCQGIYQDSFFCQEPDHGILAQYRLEIPEYTRISYFACFQKYDFQQPEISPFPEGANRLQALTVRRFRDCQQGGLFCIVEEKPGQYLLLLPLTGEHTVSFLAGSEDNLLLRTATFGTEALSGDSLPLLSWVRTDDVYQGCHQVWKQAIEVLHGSTALREEKQYPEIFEYLGWCTWEAYKCNIRESKLLEDLDRIEAGKVPVRYVLIDDGHLVNRDGALVSFQADPEKFPNGWAPILARRSREKIRWMGLWLNFNGYWNGIARENELGSLNQHLTPMVSERFMPGKNLQPKPRFPDSLAFYDAMIGSRSREGFDFVKVDNQTKNLCFYCDTRQPAEAAVQNARALEMACAFHMHGLLNCMAHGPVCIFNTRKSAVTRCSEDYKLGDLKRARRHLFNSYATIPLLGQTVWGDHDMFHSSDPVSGPVMARSKALSGGPVYLSDIPADFVPELIAPLCLQDGKLIRPLAPAAPLQENIFDNPFVDAKAYAVLAPLENRAAALALYNLSEPEIPVSGLISKTVYRQCGNMMQGQRWDLPEEGLLLYDGLTRQLSRLEADVSVTIPSFGDRLFLLVPLLCGWGVIGRQDKYLSPAGVKVLSCTEHALVIDSLEACSFAVFTEKEAISADQGSIRKIGENLWEITVDQQAVLTIFHRE